MVTTLGDTEFGDACRRLAAQALAADGAPALLVGIATGGDYVAAEMQRLLQAPLCLSVRMQRPGTKAKSRLLPRLLKALPRTVNDLLRVAESRAYALLGRLRKPHVPVINLPADTRERLAQLPAGALVLIVDDAVDSGVTMSAVAAAIRGAAPQARVRTAAVTLTRPDAIFIPDHILMPPGTIVRFPWAPDA